ncbi:hypothetical protein GUJ93_ZPchr0013g34644 [Zizania palustris]|uniref:Uncharacterized protein n=1 Tax=Zizania palustris TaxID=103762 RepID=A0A8J5X8Q0_ZIZPA|nr:hypothetical protein GUJ93_ZPchr0013g34644 [Zizania palustris]
MAVDGGKKLRATVAVDSGEKSRAMVALDGGEKSRAMVAVDGGEKSRATASDPIPCVRRGGPFGKTGARRWAQWGGC